MTELLLNSILLMPHLPKKNYFLKDFITGYFWNTVEKTCYRKTINLQENPKKNAILHDKTVLLCILLVPQLEEMYFFYNIFSGKTWRIFLQCQIFLFYGKILPLKKRACSHLAKNETSTMTFI